MQEEKRWLMGGQNRELEERVLNGEGGAVEAAAEHPSQQSYPAQRAVETVLVVTVNDSSVP